MAASREALTRRLEKVEGKVGRAPCRRKGHGGFVFGPDSQLMKSMAKCPRCKGRRVFAFTAPVKSGQVDAARQEQVETEEQIIGFNFSGRANETVADDPFISDIFDKD